jgi:hypothetical protein
VTMDERVVFRAHLDRFPLAMKGALVLRAADGIPHQVAFQQAVVAELSGVTTIGLGLDRVVQDVAPTKDLFVPFEFPVADLGSGWYRLECRVLIDGSAATVRPGKPFVVPWPRSATRRGTVDVGAAVEAGHGKVRIDQVECAGDRVRLTYEAAEPTTMRLWADARSLPSLDHEHDGETGRGTITFYPVLRGDRSLRIEVRGASEHVDVRLP